MRCIHGRFRSEEHLIGVFVCLHFRVQLEYLNASVFYSIFNKVPQSRRNARSCNILASKVKRERQPIPPLKQIDRAQRQYSGDNKTSPA